MRRLLAGAAAAAVVVAVMPAVSGQSARGAKPAPMLSGGNGTMYIGTYKGEIEIYDEATEKLVDKIVAQDRGRRDRLRRHPTARASTS